MHSRLFIISLLLLVGLVGCLEEGADNQNLDGFDSNDEVDSRFNSNSGANNNSDNEQPNNQDCRVDDDLYFDGQPATVGQACGVCQDGILSCDDDGLLACEGDTPENSCGGCGELANEPGSVCGDDLEWQCNDAGEVECREVEDPEVRFNTPDFEDIEANFDVTSTTATVETNIIILSGSGSSTILEHGFCWSTNPLPTLEDAENGLAECDELGVIPEDGNIQYTVDNLLPGRVYYVRAYVTTQLRTYYGTEMSILTDAPSVSDFVASQGTRNDAVELVWSPVEGADDYIIYRDGDEIGRVGGESSSYEDIEAQPGTLPQMPVNVNASRDLSEAVEIQWADAIVENGPEHSYAVIAVYPDANSELSEESIGFVAGLPVSDYQILIGGDWQSVGLDTNYSDTDAHRNTIDADEISLSASQGEFPTHVALNYIGEAVILPVETTYQVRAVNGVGIGEPSIEISGHYGLSEVTYSWERSASEALDNFSALSVNGPSVMDENAPESGEIRHYRLNLSAIGATDVTTESVVGFRAALPLFATTEHILNDNDVELIATVVSPGIPAAGQHGFCYGMSDAPSLENGAICSQNGVLDSAGEHRAVIDGFASGATYYARPYAINEAGVSYGAQTIIEIPLDAPVVVIGESVSHIDLSWQPINGVETYVIYRNDTEIARVPASQTAYRDTTAPSGSVPSAPSITSVTTGDAMDGVTIQWAASTVSDGPMQNYSIVAIGQAGGQSQSDSVSGRRPARTISGYEIRIGDGSWQSADISNGLEYFDGDAPTATIALGTTSASEGTLSGHIQLSTDTPTITAPEYQAYAVRAVNAAGHGAHSEVIGYRGYDSNVTYQWYVSDSGNTGTFNPLMGATSAQYSHTGAPNDGGSRYYYVTAQSGGATPVDSSIVHGYRCAGSAFQAGDGETEPYTICNLAQLATLGADITIWDKWFLMVADIDMDNETHTIIGTNDDPFVGIFDGGDNTISNLSIDTFGVSQGVTGFFGRVGDATPGEVRNLHFENAAIVGDSNVGILAGYFNGNATNISVQGSIIGDAYTGGVFGFVDGSNGAGNIENIVANTNVVGRAGSAYTGGVFGIAPMGIVSFSDITLDTVVSGIQYVGGLGGGSHGSTPNNTYSGISGTVNIESTSSHAGGLLGIATSTDLDDVDISGRIEGNGSVGGISGACHTGSLTDASVSADLISAGGDYVGGGCGLSSPFDFTNIELTGDIQSNGGYVGGLSGGFYGGIAKNISREGDIIATGNDVGGLLGNASSSGLLEDFSLNGNVESTGNYVGGFAGQLNSYSAKHIMIEGNVIGGDYTAGIIGSGGGAAVQDCQYHGTVNGSGSYIGGIIGFGGGTGAVDCIAQASVYGTGDYVGGIAGYMSGGNLLRVGSYGGEVIGAEFVGGIVGLNSGNDITQSFAEIEISGERFVGGVVGQLGSPHTISNSYYSGTIIGDEFVGGLMGQSGSGQTIETSYSYAGIAGSGTDIGPLSGTDSGATYTNVFYNSTLLCSGCDQYIGGSPLTTTEMTSIAEPYFIGFDFTPETGIWEFEDSFLPRLQWAGALN